MKIGIFIWIVLKVIPEWILVEEAQVEEVSTEGKCAKNSIEEWNLTEDMKLKEEKNLTEDMILI